MVKDNETVDLLKKTNENIKWEDTGVNMGRKPDVKTTFFDNKKPKKLRELGI